MATAKTLLYKSKKKTNGTYLIAIRVTKDRKPSYLFLEWIEEKYWDSKNNKVKKSHPNFLRLNNLIINKLTQIDNLILELETANKNFSASQIVDTIKRNRKGLSFFEFADDYILNLEKLGKIKRARPIKSRINKFNEFVKNKNLTFPEIDVNLLKRFKTHYISTNKVSERSVMNVYVAIRTLYNQAIEENLVDAKYYPFGKSKIKIKFPQTIKIGLTANELKRINELDLKQGSTIWHTRNVFMFSFNLAGTRISDTLNIKWSDIKDGRLYYKMGKNNKVDSLKLSDKSLSILSHYIDDKRNDNDFVFPELKQANLKDPKDVYNKINAATAKFNDWLKEIAKLAEINKNVTNHISRHTFGNIAGEKIDPKMLQKLYRHSHITTTMGYQGNFTHKPTDDALDSVVNF